MSARVRGKSVRLCVDCLKTEAGPSRFKGGGATAAAVKRGSFHSINQLTGAGGSFFFFLPMAACEAGWTDSSERMAGTTEPRLGGVHQKGRRLSVIWSPRDHSENKLLPHYWEHLQNMTTTWVILRALFHLDVIVLQQALYLWRPQQEVSH